MAKVLWRQKHEVSLSVMARMYAVSGQMRSSQKVVLHEGQPVERPLEATMRALIALFGPSFEEDHRAFMRAVPSDEPTRVVARLDQFWIDVTENPDGTAVVEIVMVDDDDWASEMEVYDGFVGPIPPPAEADSPAGRPQPGATRKRRRPR